MEDCKENDILSVATTLASLPDARRLAQLLLERRLAACVQIEPGLVSLYRWQDRLCEEPEVRLVIKTRPECEAALLALFAEHHPYDVPQFLAARVRASPAYAQWLRAQVDRPAP
ncbi:MAG TPA: divalent-cation tolerance protein CutA [Ramlibacter sp.]|nr:divalent-cation tolerance protein CutA [Ramlibacter sp.]